MKTTNVMLKELLLIGFALPGIASAHAADPPFAETSEQYEARLAWFRDAKLGVLISFNPSAILGREIGCDRKAPRPFDVGGGRERGTAPVYDRRRDGQRTTAG